MKTKVANASELNESSNEHALVFQEGLKELAAIHRTNKAMDGQIRRLKSSTRKKLDRIWENIRYVQAAG